jgi:hypothetical protein
MNLFNSPSDAVNACNASLEVEWSLFAESAKLDEAKDPNTYKAIKDVFRAGYMAGAKWVTGTFVQSLVASGKLPNPSSKP